MEHGRIGPYRLEDRLGAGGMGIVYKAYDERLDRWVAVKLIPPGKAGDSLRRERLRREARASARLSHPAIVQIYDLLQMESGDAIVMELVDGVTLADRLRDGPLDVPTGLLLGKEIAFGLAEAHACGLVHRDLKTENVLVTRSGHAKVLDFGIAKRLDPGDSSLTSEGVVLGTCRAMSPEQAEGRAVDTRSDLFSFGILLYEVFTGVSPFLADSPAATLHRVCSHEQQPARQLNPLVPEPLSALIDRLLEKGVALRPGEAREVAVALERIAAAVSAGAAGAAGATGTDLSEAELETLVERPPSLPRLARPSTPGARGSVERRQVTVLRCGLVSGDGKPMDLEDLLDEVSRTATLVAEAVRRFEGHLVPMQGHGWVAYFGDVQAHEDDARRAVHAALEIVSHGTPVRVGIHTGPMVVARGSNGGEDLALGETPHVAELIQSLAAPGTVLVSQATRRLIEGFFEYEPSDSFTPPGAGQPLQVWRILAGSSARSRIEVSPNRTPLVGREQELGLLLDRWTAATEGSGQVALISGEAGLGKSRLLWELKQRVAAGSPVWLEGHGSPYFSNTALHPILECLDQLIGTERGESPELRLRRLESGIARYGLPVPEVLPLLASLLSLPEDGRHPLPPMNPDVQRRKTREALVSLLLAVAERQPLLLAVEDLHWIDPSTLDLLGLLIDHSPGARIFLVLTFRPELVPPWEGRSYVMRLSLGPLTRGQASLMIERLTAGHALDTPIRDQIAARTDGVPLFVEELTKTVLESDLAGLSASGRLVTGLPPEVPSTLEGWLRARLDRLGSAREVAQLASVFGREVSAEWLSAVSPWSETELQREVDRLVAAEILYRRGFPPRHSYIFKHALLQDAAYSSLLRGDRQRLHRQIAETLRDLVPEMAERQPEVLAHHFTEAGAAEQAIPLWQKAGDHAFQRSASSEASAHLTRALTLLKTLPEVPERKELELVVALATAEAARRHPAAGHVHELYTRALELCSKVDPNPHLFPVLYGFLTLGLVRGDMEQARSAGREALQFAEHSQDNFALLSSHQKVAFVELLGGNFLLARHHVEQALAAARRGVPSSITLGLGSDLYAECYPVLSWVLWFLGYPDQALEQIHKARRQLLPGLPQGAAQIEFFASELHALRGEADSALKQAEESLCIAVQQELFGWRVQSTAARGWALLLTGDLEQSAAVLPAILPVPEQEGALMWHPQHLAAWAECQRRRGDLAGSLATLDRALECSAATGQHFVDTELHRLKAGLLAQQGAPAVEVEERLRHALEIARAQQGRSLELRAATSLARWLDGQGRRAEARAELAPVFGWFTEGFETGDLRAARELLDALS